MSLIGSTIPIPATEGERVAKGDPRRSIAVRYPGKTAYLDEVSRAAQCLIDAGYLLPEDLDAFSHGRPSAGICLQLCRKPLLRNS
jgi:hypothetical protein